MSLQIPFFKITVSVLIVALLIGAGIFIYKEGYFNRFLKSELQPLNQDRSNRYVERFPYATLEDTWMSYRNDYVQQDGRTVDKSKNFLTTSEGQSYSMLRSLWMDDKQTFDSVLTWTKNNLQKRSDSLYSWKWGQRDDGTWGILQTGGENSASDADLDIALALILANKRWNQEHYLTEAKRILNDVWAKEVVNINGRPYLVAGNWAYSEKDPTINPSYFNFAGYDIFADVDPTHDWKALKDTSYEVLNASTNKLPADWVKINRQTGQITAINTQGQPSNFSDDAVRVPWRVGLDWKWNRDQRAIEYLQKLGFLKDEWQSRKAIFRSYTLDGQPLSNEETLSTYGSVLPYFEILYPKMADQIYNEKLASVYDPDILDFKGDIGYYSKNWAWFGMAFYQDKLVNTYQLWKEGKI